MTEVRLRRGVVAVGVVVSNAHNSTVPDISAVARNFPLGLNWVMLMSCSWWLGPPSELPRRKLSSHLRSAVLVELGVSRTTEPLAEGTASRSFSEGKGYQAALQPTSPALRVASLGIILEFTLTRSRCEIRRPSTPVL